MRSTVVRAFFFGCCSLFVERCRLVLREEVIEIEVVCVAQTRFIVVLNVCCLLNHAKETMLSWPPLEVGQGQNRCFMCRSCANLYSRWRTRTVSWRLRVQRRECEVSKTTISFHKIARRVCLRVSDCRRCLRCRQACAAPRRTSTSRSFCCRCARLSCTCRSFSLGRKRASHLQVSLIDRIWRFLRRRTAFCASGSCVRD